MSPKHSTTVVQPFKHDAGRMGGEGAGYSEGV
jgi:hypothetical protein